MGVCDRVKELNGVSKGASVENGTKLELSEEGNSSEEVSEVAGLSSRTLNKFCVFVSFIIG